VRASALERCRSEPIVNSPSRCWRRWLAKCIRSQITSSSSTARPAVLVPRMRSSCSPQVVVRSVSDHSRQVGRRERVTQEEVRVQLVRVLRTARHERHEHVGVVPLRADERFGVALATVELAEYLVS